MKLGQRILWTVVNNTVPAIVLIAVFHIGRLVFDSPVVYNWK